MAADLFPTRNIVNIYHLPLQHFLGVCNGSRRIRCTCPVCSRMFRGHIPRAREAPQKLSVLGWNGSPLPPLGESRTPAC